MLPKYTCICMYVQDYIYWCIDIYCLKRDKIQNWRISVYTLLSKTGMCEKEWVDLCEISPWWPSSTSQQTFAHRLFLSLPLCYSDLEDNVQTFHCNMIDFYDTLISDHQLMTNWLEILGIMRSVILDSNPFGMHKPFKCSFTYKWKNLL